MREQGIEPYCGSMSPCCGVMVRQWAGQDSSKLSSLPELFRMWTCRVVAIPSAKKKEIGQPLIQTPQKKQWGLQLPNTVLQLSKQRYGQAVTFNSALLTHGGGGKHKLVRVDGPGPLLSRLLFVCPRLSLWLTHPLTKAITHWAMPKQNQLIKLQF